MVIPFECTFEYRSTVPATWPHLPILRCRDTSEATRAGHQRLVGYRPSLEIAGGQLVLHAAPSDHSVAESFALNVDERLIHILRPSDELHLVRTGSCDLAVSVKRHGRLVCAAGAITCLPLGRNIHAASVWPVPCPTCGADYLADKRHQCHFMIPSDKQDDPDFEADWVEPSAEECRDGPFGHPECFLEVVVGNTVRRLERAGQMTIGSYEISLFRGFQVGMPGTHECAALSRPDACQHTVAVSSAARLIGRDSFDQTIPQPAASDP